MPVQAPDSDIARYSAMYRDGWTALREARAKRAAALGIMPAGAAMVTMPTTPDWKKLDADERAAAVRVMQAYAGMATVIRSEEHTSELQSLMRISYAVFCLQKKKNKN